VHQPTYGALPKRLAYPVVHWSAQHSRQTHCPFSVDSAAALRSLRCSPFARAML
jgi:hypothetical protein